MLESNQQITYLVKGGKVANIILEDKTAPIDAVDGFDIVRGVSGGNIGDNYANGAFTPAPLAEPQADPMVRWSRQLDAARSIADIRNLLKAHPTIGYIAETDSNEIT